LIALAAATALFQSVDSEPWLHLGIGRSIAEHGFPAHEIGVLGGRGQVSWLPTWLYDLKIYWVQTLAGDAGIVVWRALWAAATMALAVRLLFVVGAASWSAVLIAPLVLSVARRHFEARPDAVAGVLVLLGLLALESARRSLRDRTRWLIPLQALGANLYGGWIAAPVVVGLYAVVEGALTAARLISKPSSDPSADAPLNPGTAESAPSPPLPASQPSSAPSSGTWARTRAWGALAVVLLGASALVLNPILNLSRPLQFMGNALRDPVTGLVAVRPWTLQGQTFDSFNALLAALAIGLALGGARVWRACPALLALTAGVVTLTLAGLPLRELLAWVAFVPLAIAFSTDTPSLMRRLKLAAAALAGAAGVAFLVLTPGFTPGFGPAPAAMPVRPTALADSVGLDGPVLNSMAAGGYIRWIRGDQHPPLLDSRGLGSRELRRLFVLADSDPVALDSLQEAWQFTHAILRSPIDERDRLALNLSRRTEWALVRYDDSGMLFVRYAHYPELAYARAYRYFTPDNLQMLDMMERGRRDPGLLDRLEQELERARRESPLHARASYWLGSIAQIRRDYVAAARHFEEAARIDPLLPGLGTKMGLLYEGLGERDKARKAYRNAMRRPEDRSFARDLLRDLEHHH